MRIYRNIRETKGIVFNNPVLTIGTFDGVHIGHQKVIKKLVSSAKALGGESVLITFDPHPRTVVQPDFELQLILSLDEKIALLEKLQVDHLVIIRFTQEFAKTSSQDFLMDYVIRPFKPKKIILGYDHHFGKDRQGDVSFLDQMARVHDFKTEQIGRLDVNEVTVSSSKIRTALRKGDMSAVSKMLGHPYTITGTVVKGNQIGRRLGFPTANVKFIEPGKMVPAYGVYATLIEWKGQVLKGMSNIGVRPTLNEHQLTLEVNIFDFNQDIYDETITLHFLEHTREEKKFRDLDLLRRRLVIDRIKVKKILED